MESNTNSGNTFNAPVGSYVTGAVNGTINTNQNINTPVVEKKSPSFFKTLFEGGIKSAFKVLLAKIGLSSEA